MVSVRTRYVAVPGDLSPRHEIVRMLFEAGDKTVSGQELGRILGISRPAVWKHVRALVNQGVPILTAKNKGYRLPGDADLIVPGAVQGLLNTKTLGQTILYASETGSTNEDGKALADPGSRGGKEFPHGTLIVAETQTKGKGRLGRRWISPPGGVFMSLLLRPFLAPAKVPALALVAGYSVALSLGNLYGLDAKVKWPNDVLISGKKVSGILCEMKAEIDKVSYVMMGIGVNANASMKSVPEKVKHTATSLAQELGRKICRNRMIASILNNLEPLYESFLENGLSDLAPAMNSVSAFLNQQVIVTNRSLLGEDDETGIMRGIDGQGRLLLETANGRVKPVETGDVSLRKLPGRV